MPLHNKSTVYVFHVRIWHYLVLFILLLTGCNASESQSGKVSNPIAAEGIATASDTENGSITYYSEKSKGEGADDQEDADDNESRLIANVDGEVLQGPSAAIVLVEKEMDFNGDGVMDALVSFSEGGNCCPSTYMFATVKNGEVVTETLDDGWGTYEVIEENGQVLVKQTSSDATIFYTFTKDFEVKVRKVPQLVMVAEKEVNGVGAMYSGNEKEKTLKLDLNADGVIDEIHCDIWPRWGTLTSCSLPLPDGGIQLWDQACERIGVLKSSRNGYREIVCDNNIVIYFDGKKWVTDEKK